MPQFAGEFELHLTVALDTPETWAVLRQRARLQGLKCVHIVLPDGSWPSQPMLTAHHVGTLTSELARGRQLCDELSAAGLQPIRLKLEVSADHPEAMLQAHASESSRYFEQHVKVLLSAEADRSSLTDLARRNAAHWSRNALKQRTDGCMERFLTQRVEEGGHTRATQRLKSLLHDLQSSNISWLRVEREYVVFDSRLELDAGWINREPCDDDT